MENEINLDEFKIQVNKIVQLLNSYTISQRLEAFNYFFTNVNFVFPLFSQENCFIEPNLKISLVLLSSSKDKVKEVSSEKEIIENKSIVCYSNNNQQYREFEGNFFNPNHYKQKTVKINFNSLKIPIKSLIGTRKLLINNCDNINFLQNSLRFLFKSKQLHQIDSTSKFFKLYLKEQIFKKRILAISESSSSRSSKKFKRNNDDNNISEESEDDHKEDTLNIEIERKKRNRKKLKKNKLNTSSTKNTENQDIIGKTFNCLQCDKTYRKKSSLMSHSNHYHPGLCPFCGQYYGTTAKELGEHNKMYHIDELPFVCDECGESFKRNQQYQVHLEVHEKKKNEVKINCTICSLEFKSVKCYEKHTQEKHKLEGYVCEQCGAHFKKKLNLHQHNTKFHRKEIPCPHCDKKFSYKSNLDRHILLLHTESKKKYICEQCGTDYFSPLAVKEHIAYAHKETKEFVCDICKKGFSAKRAWQRHQIVHSDERPFDCNLCQRTFKIKSNLVRHKHLTHNQNQPDIKLKQFTKTDEGELIPIEENTEPQKPKRTRRRSKKTPQPNTETPQSTIDETNNFMHIINNEMQYPLTSCSDNQNINMIQINQNYNAYGDDNLENSINNMLMQANNHQEPYNNDYNQANYNLQTDNNVWNNVQPTNAMEEYSLFEVSPEGMMSLQLKQELNRNDNQIMNIPNSNLIQYQYIWNPGDTQHLDQYSGAIDPNAAQNNSYSNIGSILTNLEMMDNQSNQTEMNMHQHHHEINNMPHIGYHDQTNDINQTSTSHQQNLPHHIDQSHLNYDFNSQNHTITDISNTFLKKNENGSSMMENTNDVIESTGLNPKQIKVMQQNTNENVMLPSLLDYLQHPYQF